MQNLKTALKPQPIEPIRYILDQWTIFSFFSLLTPLMPYESINVNFDNVCHILTIWNMWGEGGPTLVALHCIVYAKRA